MRQAEEFDRDSTLFVARGLYILRYETGRDGHEAPTAFVTPANGFENIIEIIGVPGAFRTAVSRGRARSFLCALPKTPPFGSA